MSKYLFNPFSQKDRDALHTQNGKRGVKLAIIIGVIVVIIIVVANVI